MKTKYITVVKYLLSILFIYAGTYKITDVSLFASQMYQSPLLPSFIVPYLAFGAPLFEIVLGLLMILSAKLEHVLLWVSFSLMLFFSTYLIMLFTLYSKPPCACGGILSGMDYPVHIAFNISFTLLAGFALYLYEKTETAVSLI
ncbi:putative membrane protein YphA (DoxX/SURF4 family) [Mucilaginibacter sp. OAE612]|uniref:MauE/DoxX family redox-associated membrane protein n=1 Tax=Mucilaginibacter sp. OAE612 TaxID=3156444 RepID=UPI00359CCB37